METRKSESPHARLQMLVGRWRGAETVFPVPGDPAGGAATAVVETHVALAGAIVVQDYQQIRNGAPGFSGHAVFWWDAPAGEYAMTWFDAMSGTPTEYRGSFEARMLRLVHAAPDGGFSRCTFDCRAGDRYVFTLETSLDGHGWSAAIEGVYERVPPPAARPPSPRRTVRAPGARAKASPAALAKAVKAATAPKAAKARSNVKAAAARARGVTGTRAAISRRGRRRR